MEEYDDSFEDVQITLNGRRKRADKSQHCKEKVKRARHSGGGKVPQKACVHEAVKDFCHAEYLTGADMALNQTNFYQSCNKVEQDAYLLRLMDVHDAERKRVTDENRKRDRNTSTSYRLLTLRGQLKVCKATFCSVLGISKDRVTRVAKYFKEHRAARPENRGGCRKTEEFSQRRQEIADHITRFKCKASHYSRKDQPGRKYLPSELSLCKMHRLFNEQNHAQVSLSLYYSVFRGNFNLGFGHPASDVCSTCTKFRNDIKSDLAEADRKVLAAKFILHRRQARQFYNTMNNVGETITVCFDVMENLVLPKTPIGQAYYSRQLYQYIFGIVIHRADGTQMKPDIHLYSWLECQNRKDSNMIASALHHFLTTVAASELAERQELRLFSDSCFGQNKNMNMMSMLMALKHQRFSHLDINYTFPVRGHSFLPADRVFGRIEQDIRRKTTILLPEEYLQIMGKHGQVHEYLKEWECLDFKTTTAAFIKQARPFKLSEAKVVQVVGSGLGLKPTYSGEVKVYPVLKKGKRWDNFKPPVLAPTSCVKSAKRSDTFKLLQHIGAPQAVQDQYTQLLGADENLPLGERSGSGSDSE